MFYTVSFNRCLLLLLRSPTSYQCCGTVADRRHCFASFPPSIHTPLPPSIVCTSANMGAIKSKHIFYLIEFFLLKFQKSHSSFLSQFICLRFSFVSLLSLEDFYRIWTLRWPPGTLAHGTCQNRFPSAIFQLVVLSSL